MVIGTNIFFFQIWLSLNNSLLSLLPIIKKTYKGYLWEKGHIHNRENIRPAEYLDVVVFLDADWHPMKRPLFSRLLIPFKCHLLKMPIIQNTDFRINTLTAVLFLEDHLHHTKHLVGNIWKLIRLNNSSIMIKIIMILQNNTWSYKHISFDNISYYIKLILRNTCKTYKLINDKTKIIFILELITSYSCTVIQTNRGTNFSCNVIHVDFARLIF